MLSHILYDRRPVVSRSVSKILKNNLFNSNVIQTFERYLESNEPCSCCVDVIVELIKTTSCLWVTIPFILLLRLVWQWRVCADFICAVTVGITAIGIGEYYRFLSTEASPHQEVLQNIPKCSIYIISISVDTFKRELSSYWCLLSSHSKGLCGNLQQILEIIHDYMAKRA